MNSQNGLKNYLFGFASEDKAAAFLENLNYKILQRNYKTKFGEIDIIAQKNSITHFFEVKASKNDQAYYKITQSKLSKLIKTIDHYFLQNTNTYFQLNAIIISQDKIELIENITV